MVKARGRPLREIAGAIEEAQRHNAEGRSVLLDIHTNLEGRRSTFS